MKGLRIKDLMISSFFVLLASQEEALQASQPKSHLFQPSSEVKDLNRKSLNPKPKNVLQGRP